MRLMLRWLVLSLLALTLNACGVIQAVLLGSYNITVINRCTGPNTTVDFYLGGAYQGAVYLNRTFSGIPAGTYTLYAVGTGRGGARFERTTYVDSDIRWTLCP